MRPFALAPSSPPASPGSPRSVVTPSLLRAAAVAALTFTVAACAGGAGGAGGARADAATAARVTAPRMVSRVRPEFRFPPGRPTKGKVIDLRVEVLIDADGRPDLETLRVTGVGALDNQESIARWLQMSTFEPATQGGRPVPAVYRTRFTVSVESRTMD